MRKLVLLVLLTPLISFAGSKEIPLPQVMLQMEKDTIKILKGFLRNNNKMILEGVKDIQNHPQIISQIYKYAKPERRTEGFKKYIAEFDKFVRKEAKEVEKYIKQGNKAKASAHFAKLIDRCNGCHAVFRGW